MMIWFTTVYILLFILASGVFALQPGENCDPEHSSNGACGETNDGEQACFDIGNGYPECSPPMGEYADCNPHNLGRECQLGLECVGGYCTPAASLDEPCFPQYTSPGVRASVCGRNYYCDEETSTCEEKVTTPNPAKNQCPPDNNYGHWRCDADLYCDVVGPFSDCRPRKRRGDRCNVGRDCSLGLQCRNFVCQDRSQEGRGCVKDFDCCGNLSCIGGVCTKRFGDGRDIVLGSCGT